MCYTLTMKASPNVTDFASCKAWIAGGKNKDSHRKVANNTYAVKLRVMHPPEPDGGEVFVEDAYGIRFHETIVVAYLEDGRVVLNTGGWTTVTTKARFRDYSPARVGSYRLKGGTITWVVFHEDDPISAPKVQKCRARGCKGTGTITTWCDGYGGSSWHARYEATRDSWAALPGMTYHYHDEWTAPSGKVYITDEDRVRDRRDRNFRACWHGFIEPHIQRTECYQCGGTGQKDYGSAAIPAIFLDGTIVDSTGKVVDTFMGHISCVPKFTTVDKANGLHGGWTTKVVPAKEQMPGLSNVSPSLPSYHYTPPVPDPYHMGSADVLDILGKLNPNITKVLDKSLHCPICGTVARSVSSLVMHLNDSEKWTRRAIADHLDTLDLDLNLNNPAPDGVGV